MNGANKLFLANPRTFLINNNIKLLTDAVGDPRKEYPTYPDIFDFDLVHVGTREGRPTYELWNYINAKRVRTWCSYLPCARVDYKIVSRGCTSHPIRAYWLPWYATRNPSIQLDGTHRGDPKVFFTSEMSGCRLEIEASATPKVQHITGLIDDGEKERIANAEFAGLAHRKFSLRSGYPDADTVTVVGYRARNNWAFYAQGRDRTAQDLQVGTHKFFRTI